MTFLEKSLYQAMQEKRFSYGCCVAAMTLLAGNNAAVRDALLYLTDRNRVSEKAFIAQVARLCQEYGINPNDKTSIR